MPYGLASLFSSGTLKPAVDSEEKGHLSSASGGNERHCLKKGGRVGVGPLYRANKMCKDGRNGKKMFKKSRKDS